MKFKSKSTRLPGIAALLGCCILVVFALAAYSPLAQGRGSPTPKPGTYSGLAGPDAISFKVSAGGGSVSGLSSSFNPASFCGVPTSGEHERFPSMQVRNAHFSGSTASGGESGGTVTHFAVQGRFTSPTRATGKISGHFTVRSLPPCHASSSFSVRRKGK